MKKARSLFLFTCCLLVAIGPFNVLQVIAWGNMIHDYSSERTISEAAEMTFSGEYPCEMCRRIAEAKAKATEEQNRTPFQSEERPSLRLVLHCNEDSKDKTISWLSSSTLAPGVSIFHAPGAHFQRVPTPPPQKPTC